jgi:hypothetical protein
MGESKRSVTWSMIYATVRRRPGRHAQQPPRYTGDSVCRSDYLGFGTVDRVIAVTRSGTFEGILGCPR